MHLLIPRFVGAILQAPPKQAPWAQPNQFASNAFIARQTLASDAFQPRFGARGEDSGSDSQSESESASSARRKRKRDPYAGWTPEQKLIEAKRLVDSGIPKYKVARKVRISNNKLAGYTPQPHPYAGWTPEQKLIEAKRLVDSGDTKDAAAKKVRIDHSKLAGYQRQGPITRTKRDQNTDPYAGWAPEQKLNEAKRLMDSGDTKHEAARKVSISNNKLIGYQRKTADNPGESSESSTAPLRKAMDSTSISKLFTHAELLQHINLFLHGKSDAPLPKRLDIAANKKNLYSLLAQLEQSLDSEELSSGQLQWNQRAYKVLKQALKQHFPEGLSSNLQSYLTSSPVPHRTEAPLHSITASRGDAAPWEQQQAIIDYFREHRDSFQPFPSNANEQDLQAVGRQLQENANRNPGKFASVNQKYQAALSRRQTAATTDYSSPKIQQTIDPRQLQITSSSSYRSTTAPTATRSLPTTPHLPPGYSAVGPLRTTSTHGLFPRQLVLQDVTEYPGGPIRTFRLQDNTWGEYEEPRQISSRR
jgi:hypothetical protein